MGAYARANFPRRRCNPSRSCAQLRYGDQCISASHGLRRRRQAGSHSHQPTRRDARSRHGSRHLSRPRRSPVVPCLSRPGARLWNLPVRPVEASIHHAAADPTLPRRCASRHRDSCGWKRCGRAARFSVGHDRPARPSGSRVWGREIQRLQYVLLRGCIEYLGRLVRLSGHRHSRPCGRAECGCRYRRRVELLPAARSRGARTALHRTESARRFSPDLRHRTLSRSATFCCGSTVTL